MFKPIIMLSAILSTIVFITLRNAPLENPKFSDQVTGRLNAPEFITVDCGSPDTVYIQSPAGFMLHPEDVAIYNSSCDSVHFYFVDLSGFDVDSLNFGCNIIFQSPVQLMVIATDTCGMSDTCMNALVILDTIPPVIICPMPSTYCSFAVVPPVATTIDEFNRQGGEVDDNCFEIAPPDNFLRLISADTTATPCGQSIHRKYEIIDFDRPDMSHLADTCVQTIYIVDTLTMSCSPATYHGYASELFCHDTIKIDTPKVHSGCGLISLTSNAPINKVYPLGTTNVTWTAINSCLDTITCTVQVVVSDTIAPELSCNGNLVFNLSYDPQNTWPVDSILNSTSDNCTATDDIVLKVRRMDTGCVAGSDQFGDNVTFCCEDVGSTVMVALQATDGSSNKNTCMIAVSVFDKLPPVIDEVLPDLTVSCNYYIDLNDLSAFGTIVFDENDIQEIDIDDPLFQALSGPFYDGFITDNCPSNLSFVPTLMDMRNHYHTGNIIRKFLVTDGNGNTVSTQQIITVVDSDTLEEADIIWPADTHYTDCTVDVPDTSMTGSPIIAFDDICTIPGISYHDLVFDDPTSGCLYVRRTWKVIDWAKFVPNTNHGVFYHVQDIHLINTVAPTFISGCDDLEICAPLANCNATLKLRASAEDDCTDKKDIAYFYNINLNNDGGVAEISGQGDSINQLLERGTHLVTWFAEDRCGNVAQCSFEVTIKECKAPTPIAYNGLSTNINQDGTVTIWAKDFNNHSSDNCTAPQDLRYSFSSDINVLSKTFTCDDLGPQSVSMWVTDMDGNQSHANTFILITDNLGFCPDNQTSNKISIAGKVATDENTNIPDASVTISDGNGMNEAVISDANGQYKIDNLKMYSDYLVQPEKNKEWIEGISTLDLVLMQRHILGITKLTNPYKLIAADVNGDRSISASDLVALRKLLIGTSSKVEGNKPWRFVDAAYVFPEPLHPWPFVESMAYSDLDVNMMSSNFIAVKIGDVNGSVNDFYSKGQAENRGIKEMAIEADDMPFEIGKIINVPIYGRQDINLEAIQLSFKYDVNALDFIGILSESTYLENEEYASISDGKDKYINIVKTDLETWRSEKDKVMFTLQFRTKTTGSLSSYLALDKENLSALAYDSDDQKFHLDLRYKDKGSVLEVGQNSPNPFTETSLMPFTLANEMPIEINIYNNAGARIYSDYKHYSAGVHYLNIGSEQLQDNYGVFFVHIETGELTEIKKIIRIK